MDSDISRRYYKKYMPKVLGDYVAMTFTIVTIHVIALFELFVVLPYIDHDGSKFYWLHAIMGVFIYINVMTSMYLTITTDATSGSVILPSILKPDWRFCAACEANSPPRSFHCWACKVCILRRDHHCVFTGNCIGHANQRFYMTMILYLWIAASYCTFLNMDYTFEVLGGLNWRSMITMIMPMMAWLFGISATFNFTVCFISSTCLIGFFLLATLIGYHMINIVSGQTVHERAICCKDYDLGFKRNLEVVFGRKWVLAWLSPWVSSPLPSDGIVHRKKNQPAVETVKDL